MKYFMVDFYVLLLILYGLQTPLEILWGRSYYLLIHTCSIYFLLTVLTLLTTSLHYYVPPIVKEGG